MSESFITLDNEIITYVSVQRVGTSAFLLFDISYDEIDERFMLNLNSVQAVSISDNLDERVLTLQINLDGCNHLIEARLLQGFRNEYPGILLLSFPLKSVAGQHLNGIFF